MSRALIVALREYRQIAATRGFWVTLMIFPLIIAASSFSGRLISPQTKVAYVLADASGRYARAIRHRLDLDDQRSVLFDLAAYAQRWKVADAAPGAVWAAGPRWFGDADVEAFTAAGGWKGAMARLTSRLPADAPAFKPAAPAVAPAEGGLAPSDQGPAAFGAAIEAHLEAKVATAYGLRPLAVAVYIPRDFGAPGIAAHVWTTGRTNGPLIATIGRELAGALRSEALIRSGLPPAAVARIWAVGAPMIVTTPPPGHGRLRVIERSILPLTLVYLLLLTVIVTGSMMLQGLIEERANKLLESVLACVRPRELMYGKLLGLGAVGLTMVSVWSGCAAGAALALHGAVADLLRPSLQSLDHPWIGAALIFYFLAGYLEVSMIFLAIGSISDSLQDAQAYLMPVVMIVMLPVMLMMGASVQNPNGPLPEILSWIPLYTPFAILARLGSGLTMADVLGTGVVLIGFIALEAVALGRLFQVSLLRAGQPPKLGALVGLMRRAGAD